MSSRRFGIWGARILAVVAVAGMIVFFVHERLDRADQFASAIGAVLTLITVVTPVFVSTLGSGDGRAPDRRRQRRWELRGVIPARVFLGRDSELAALKARLSDARNGNRLAIVMGAPGAGKTALALHHAERCHYRYVCLVDGENVDAAARQLVDAADAVGLELPQDIEVPAALQRVKRHLASATGWLLIIDEAREVPSVLAELLPSTYGGDVVVTTAYARFELPVPLRDTCVDLPPLPGDVCRRLLTLSAGPLARATDEEWRRLGALSEGNPARINALAAPLALGNLSVTEHLTALTARGRSSVDAAGESPVLQPVALWSELIAELTPPARELAEIFSVLGKEAVPRALVSVVPSTPGTALVELTRPGQRNVVLSQLTARRMISSAGPAAALRLDGILRTELRDQMDPATFATRMLTAAELLDMTFPTDVADPTMWGLCGDLEPHIRALAAHAVDGRGAQGEALSERVLAVASRCADYLTHRGLPRVAYDVLTGLVKDQPLPVPARADAEGPPSPQEASDAAMPQRAGLMAHAHLAEAARAAQLLVEAEELGCRALHWCGTVLGVHDEVTLKVMNDLATTYLDGGRLAQARDLLERAYPLAVSGLGATHERTLTILGDLGQVYEQLDLPEPGLDAALDVLDGRLARVTDVHYDVILSRGNAALALKRCDRLDEAWQQAQACLAAGQDALPPTHGLRQLGVEACLVTASRPGQLRWASRLGRRLWRRLRDDPGVAPGRLISLQSARARAQWTHGRLTGARGRARILHAAVLQRQALRRAEHAWGSDALRTVKAKALLAWMLEDLGLWDEAAGLLREVWTGWVEAHGDLQRPWLSIALSAARDLAREGQIDQSLVLAHAAQRWVSAGGTVLSSEREVLEGLIAELGG
jgi:tetratricopeptide (TPR) repeat protein